MGAPGGAAVAQRDSLNRTPLYYACEKGNARIVAMLLRDSEVRASADAPGMYISGDEATALGMACLHGHGECVELLRLAAADVLDVNRRFTDSSGLALSPLLAACRNRDPLVLEELLKFGSRIDLNFVGEYQTRDYQTPLMAACDAGLPVFVERLLEAEQGVTGRVDPSLIVEGRQARHCAMAVDDRMAGQACLWLLHQRLEALEAEEAGMQ